MTLKEYAKIISKLARQHPAAHVVYAADDEGNGFCEVRYAPCAGHFDSINNDWLPEIDLNDGIKDINSVCIN